jgi:putative transposase
MSRQPSSLVAQRNKGRLQRIRALKAEYPVWEYRRSWAYLRFVEQLPVNKKRILRLMREHQLLVTPNRRLIAKRTPTGKKPQPTRPNEWWDIDMTKVLVAGIGWIYIVVVLDLYTKMIVGYYVGMQCQSQHWRAALEMAVNRQFPRASAGRA